MTHTETTHTHATHCTLPVIALGFAASIFLAISYALCVLFYVVFPASADQHVMLSMFQPVLDFTTWQGFLLGLVSVFACGWYFAAVFGTLYNFFAARFH